MGCLRAIRPLKDVVSMRPRLKHPRRSPRLKQYHPKVPLSETQMVPLCETQSGSFKRDALKEQMSLLKVRCLGAIR